MEKYYTPRLEDLHIGFECEEWIESYPEGFWSDVSEPIDKDKLEKILGYCERDEEYLKQNYRVKHLDKEDFESLQWKLISEEIKTYSHWCVFKKQGVEISVQLKNVNKKYPNHLNFRGDNNTFFGNFKILIRNKSELKTLLNQLENVRK